MSDSEGIMIFKDTMEYLINGDINEMQYAYLTKLIYETRWGNGVDDNTIEDRDVRMIWKTLKHSVKKSKTNATQYAKNKKNKPNKPQKSTDDIDIPQEEESVSEGPIQGEFDNTIEEFEAEITPSTNDDIEYRDLPSTTNMIETISNAFIEKHSKEGYDIYYRLNILKYKDQTDTEEYKTLREGWHSKWDEYSNIDNETLSKIKERVVERYNRRFFKDYERNKDKL